MSVNMGVNMGVKGCAVREVVTMAIRTAEKPEACQLAIYILAMPYIPPSSPHENMMHDPT